MPDSDESATRTLSAARELGPKIRAAADEKEQGRRLPMQEVLPALAEVRDARLRRARNFRRQCCSVGCQRPPLHDRFRPHLATSRSISKPMCGPPMSRRFTASMTHTSSIRGNKPVLPKLSFRDRFVRPVYCPAHRATELAAASHKIICERGASDSTPIAWACFSATTCREARKTASPLIAVQS
jgi:hypothetical protein